MTKRRRSSCRALLTGVAAALAAFGVSPALAAGHGQGDGPLRTNR